MCIDKEIEKLINNAYDSYIEKYPKVDIKVLARAYAKIYNKYSDFSIDDCIIYCQEYFNDELDYAFVQSMNSF